MKGILKLKVILWGEEIGLLVWDDVRQVAIFQFSEHYHRMPYNVQPTRPGKPIPAFLGMSGDKYHGLPPFVADSLPDRWGSVIFDCWAQENGISPKDCNPLLWLAYIGKRGLGALEFEPEIESEPGCSISSLLSIEALARRTYENRAEVVIFGDEREDFEALARLGSPPGGAHAKILIAISDADGSVISGQVEPKDGYTQYILKFKEDYDIPSCEIEYVYCLMAKTAGITMMPSRLIRINGNLHFLTRRFDRQGDKKLLSQTMAALVPNASDYQNLFFLCDTLALTADEKDELFRRMCFNVVAGVTDDHNKNFSFLMFPDGHWELAPAYDLTFTANTAVNSTNGIHSLGICSKRSNFTADDIVGFGEDFEIRNPEGILRDVCRSVSQFRVLADAQSLPSEWIELIASSLDRLFPERESIAARIRG